MNHTQQRRRPAVWMQGHALALAFRQRAQDRADADHMRRLARLSTIKASTRHHALAGI